MSTTQIDPATPPAADSTRTVLTAAKGGGIFFVGSLLAYAARFLIGFLMARALGSEQFGLYNLALTAATVAAGLSLMGLTSALVRYIALFLSQHREDEVQGVLQIGLTLTTSMSLLMGIAIYVGATPIAERLFNAPSLAPLLRLASFMVPFMMLIDLLSAATRGFHRMEHSVIADVGQPLLKLLLVGGLAFIGLDASSALWAHFISAVAITLLLIYFLNTLFKLRWQLKATWPLTKKVVVFSLPLYLDYAIQTFRSNIQTVLLGALNTIATVGVFTVATQVNMVGQIFHQSIVTVSMPIVSELTGRKDYPQLARFYQTMTKWTFSLNLPLFLAVILFPKPILSIFGEDFVTGATALSILAWGNLVNTGTGICGVVINMSGHTTFNLVNSIILSILTVTLNWLLIPQWGVEGAAVATMSAVVIVNLLRISEVFALFRILPYNKSFLKPLTAGIVTCILSLMIRQFFHTDANVFYAVVNMALLLGIYVVMVLVLGLSPEDRAVLARLGQRFGLFARKS